MHLTEEEFVKLTKLCRIECNETEKEKLFQNIFKILSYFEQLNELATSDIAPCNQVVATLNNITREDEIGPLLAREEFLANAPSHIGGMIKVPSILKTST